MTFLERLRKYLLLVAGGTSVSRTLFEPDEAWVQKKVIDNFDELARTNMCGAQGRKELFDDLVCDGEGLAFVERMVASFTSSAAHEKRGLFEQHAQCDAAAEVGGGRQKAGSGRGAAALAPH